MAPLSAQSKRPSPCEYRQLFVTPQPAESDPGSWSDQSPEFADELSEAVEKLDAAIHEGWTLVGVSVEKDAKGHRWLSALLKKPLLGEVEQLAGKVHAAAAPLSIFRAA